jgi:hypothetical protein
MVHGWLAVAGIVLAVAIAMDLHLRLSRYISPIWQTISEYVNGTTKAAVNNAAALFTVMCLALAFGSLALLSGIGARRRDGRPLALMLLGVWSTGLLLVAMFPVDPPGAARTVSGELHNCFALTAFVALPSAAWALTRPGALRCPWHGSRRLIRGLATASLTATATLVVVFLRGPAALSSPLLAVGVHERVVFAIDLVLLLAMARPLLRRTDRAGTVDNSGEVNPVGVSA